jgi:hypothetical protein
MAANIPTEAPRQRRKMSPLQEAARAAAEASSTETAVDDEFDDDGGTEVIQPAAVDRRAMRPEMRAESSRERAARKAAEIRENIGDLDEGVDEFYVDPKIVPDGWTYEWKRKSAMGLENPSYMTALARTGWDPVPTVRHPFFMPTEGAHPIIERKGMILMERPKEITDEVKGIEVKKARGQVRQKEQQIKGAPEGTLERTLHKVKKSYEPLPVPD